MSRAARGQGPRGQGLGPTAGNPRRPRCAGKAEQGKLWPEAKASRGEKPVRTEFKLPPVKYRHGGPDGGTWCVGVTVSPAHVSSPSSGKCSSPAWPPAAAPAKGPSGCRRDAIAFPGAPPSVRGFPWPPGPRAFLWASLPFVYAAACRFFFFFDYGTS